MHLQLIAPTLELQPYITKIWLLESNSPVLSAQNSLIVPNGRMKLMIVYRGCLTTTDKHKTAVCREGDVGLIGLRDAPVTLGSSPGAAGSIGIEFTTAGASRFFNLPLYELSNNLFSLADLFGKQGTALIRQLNELEGSAAKINLVQQYLVNRLRSLNNVNTVVDYAIGQIQASKGLLEIGQLEKQTGYSRRYLSLLFRQHIGLPPKTLATIVRFQHFYKDANQWNELYYDQSHFIREFRHFTGMAPHQYIKMDNAFGKKF